MVDLSSTLCEKPPPTEAEQMNQETEEVTSSAKQLCRLCLREDDVEPDKAVDIFEESGVDNRNKESKAIENLLYELFGIKVSNVGFGKISY